MLDFHKINIQKTIQLHTSDGKIIVRVVRGTLVYTPVSTHEN